LSLPTWIIFSRHHPWSSSSNIIDRRHLGLRSLLAALLPHHHQRSSSSSVIVIAADHRYLVSSSLTVVIVDNQRHRVSPSVIAATPRAVFVTANHPLRNLSPSWTIAVAVAETTCAVRDYSRHVLGTYLDLHHYRSRRSPCFIGSPAQRFFALGRYRCFS